MFMLQSNYNVIENQDELNHNSILIEGNTDVSDDTSHHESTNENDSDHNINVDADMHDENLLSKKKNGLRKGKWTSEEERYTNKVIEAFNAGTLKLSENERGITLRAYLADKLGCDPMRITKKYTGASCLGKRVYHAHKQVAPTEQIEKVTLELNILEQNFRHKLQQINRTRNGTNKTTETNNNTISTPAIDALFNNNVNFPASAWNQVLSSKIQNVNNYLYPIPMSGYPPNCTIPQYRSNNNDQFMQIFPPNYHYYLKAAAENGFLQYEKCDRTYSIGCEGGSLSSGQTGITTKTSESYHIPHTNNSSLNQYIHYQNQKDRNYPSHPSLGMKSTIESNYISVDQLPVEVPPPLTMVPSYGNIVMSSLEQLTEEESSNDGHSNEDQEKKHAAIPISNKYNPEIIPYHYNNRDNVDVNHEQNSNKFYTNKLPQSHNKKVKVSERDSEAANSLLGFFTQLERNNSQEDLIEFLEDVQKTAVASTTPKSSNVSTVDIIFPETSVNIQVPSSNSVVCVENSSTI